MTTIYREVTDQERTLTLMVCHLACRALRTSYTRQPLVMAPPVQRQRVTRCVHRA
jgi:hypothetical protein